MILGFAVETAVGLLCLVFGLLIWKKQKVSLIHDYHYKNVRKEDIPAYTRLMGIGLILMGVGICTTGFLNLFESAAWWIPMLAGFIAGFILMNRAQKKYNGTWVS
jgi:FtsH-binding integral membrane protein